MKYAIGEKVGISIKAMMIGDADMDYVDIATDHDGEDCSAIYKTEINEKTGYRETDYNSFIHYEVDFNNSRWKENLLNELYKAFEKLHKIGI